MRVALLGNFRVDHTSETHHAKSLAHLGHSVERLQETEVTADQIADVGMAADLFCWIHTHGWSTPGIAAAIERIKAAGVTTMTYHLDLWRGLKRERDMKTDPYWSLDHFFTADRLMADHLNTNTPVRGHYLPPGVFGDECYIAEPQNRFDIAFVGSRRYHPEWDHRPKLISWLESIYGDRFRLYGSDSRRGVVRGSALNQVYADARITVGDTLCLNFDYPDYWSDRLPETLGRGGFLLMPQIPGMERDFTDGEHLVYWEFGDFDQLQFLIDYYLHNQDEADMIRRQGHEHVKAHHTYRHRWETILTTLAGC